MPSGEDPIARDAYDEIADEYAAEVEESAYNADFEFPATTSLVPDVAGKRVLDAGCGTGTYTEWLLDQGADVVAVDASAEMLAHARDRVGDRAEFHQADLAEPLAFAADGEFDGVVSPLVLGYVRDWRPTFAEFARTLEPGGFVVFSVKHPLDDFDPETDGSYYEVERKHKEWAVEVPYYRRPVSEMLNPVAEAGFRVETVAEPQPTEAFREKRPDAYEKESRHPVFLCVRAVLE